jgi:hypothetical protein
VKIPNLFGLPYHQTKEMMIHQCNGGVAYDIFKMVVLVGMFLWYGLNSVKVFMYISSFSLKTKLKL